MNASVSIPSYEQVVASVLNKLGISGASPALRALGNSPSRATPPAAPAQLDANGLIAALAGKSLAERRALVRANRAVARTLAMGDAESATAAAPVRVSAGFPRHVHRRL